ncbi:MAG: hypothetical protein LLG40_13245 [Deltaproteobacteria bacterium]|nr:hypothetical protein [Deltaproteobacteria bacterium]
MSDDIITKQLKLYRGFNSAYAKTSAPKVDQLSVFDAFPDAASRRALASINNRVLGTAPAGLQAGTASLAGIAINSAVSYVIDGKVYAGTASTNVPIPTSLGTQGTGSFCKYLMSYGTDGVVTFTKGNESTAGINGTYYPTADGGEAPGAFLPDLPDKSCPIGYFVVTTTTRAYTAGVGAPATNNTVAYNDLMSMPILES